MRYCWFDVETTGTQAKNGHALLELGAIMTEGLFQEIARFHTYFMVPPNTIWDHEVVIMHSKNQLIEELCATTLPTLSQGFSNFRDFLIKYGNTTELQIAAGSSIHFDVEFIKHFDPSTAALFSHRQLDVSAIKMAIKSLYGSIPKHGPDKPAHRAIPDTEASMMELKYLIENYFKDVPLPSL